MKINIIKENEHVYFSIDEEEKQSMNFENLVELSEKVIRLGKEATHDIECTDNSLELYKSTIKELINSLMIDDELLDLLSQKKELSNE